MTERELLNELLHQIDINDFVDSHGHSAKMLKAVHDAMLYLAEPAPQAAPAEPPDAGPVRVEFLTPRAKP